jgi:hypothetical protein
LWVGLQPDAISSKSLNVFAALEIPQVRRNIKQVVSQICNVGLPFVGAANGGRIGG